MVGRRRGRRGAAQPGDRHRAVGGATAACRTCWRAAATRLTSLGRLTGLVASDLLLVQVLAMARVPLGRSGPSARTGWPAGTGWLGFTSFHLMLAHVVLITLGYAVTAHDGVLPELWDLVSTYPGMLLATAGTAAAGHGRRHLGAGGPPPAALRVVAPAAPLRLPRRRAGAAAPALDRHRLRRPRPPPARTGGRCTPSPPARVLVYRLGPAAVAHACGTGWWSARVVAEAPGVVSVHLTRPAAAPAAGAGRAVLRLAVPRRPRLVRGRTRTRCRPRRTRGLLRITVKDLGDGSARGWPTLRPGTRVLIEGPYGAADRRRRTEAAGVTCSPPASASRRCARCSRSCPSTRRRDPGLPGPARGRPRLPRPSSTVWPRGAGVRVAYLLGPRAAPAVVAVTGRRRIRRCGRAALPVADIAAHDVYVCGPDDWTDAALRPLAVAGVP